MIKSIAMFCILMLSGCGILQSLKETPANRYLYKINKDPIHVNSCGPKALYKALKKLNHHITIKEISYNIQEGGDIARTLLALFDTEARSITWPSEIKAFLKEHGYILTEVKNIDSLHPKSVAIILVKKAGGLDYHWMCFPVDAHIKTFYGSKTIVKMVLLINPKKS